MIDREHDLPITRQAEVLQHQPRQRLLPAAAGAGRRPRDHAAARPAASGVPIRRFADVARPAGCRGVQDRPSACEDADAADGDRSALSPSAHDQARAGPQDLSRTCCAASRSRGRTRCGRWTSPTSRWRVASSIWPSCSTGSAVACCRGGCRSPWKRRSASRRWRMPWLVTASRTSSTPTRARSSPARPSPACSPTTALRSAWTARAHGGTTCSSSGCGAASNTRRCICGPTTASARPAHRSADISTSTIAHRNTHLAM